MDIDLTEGAGEVGPLSAFIDAHLSQALGAASIGCWAWDPATDRATWSLPTSSQILQDPPMQEGTLREFALLATDGDREHITMIDLRSASPAIHRSFHYSRGDGAVGRLRLDAALVESAGSQIYVGVLSDTTDEMAIETTLAASFAERDRVAHLLEASLLPPILPNLPGFTVDADYRSAEGIATGDFYDLFPLAGDDWGFAIGDVTGHGTEAAALTTVVRYTLRATALVRRHPAKVMAAANQTHLAAVKLDRFTTAHYLRINRRGTSVHLRVATAGHPDLIIVRSTGSLERLGGKGPMLGMMKSARFVEGRAQLEPGDAVVAFTDGVVEARSAGRQFGRSGLESFLAEWTGPPVGLAAAINDAALRYGHGRAQDDMATVVLRRNS